MTESIMESGIRNQESAIHVALAIYDPSGKYSQHAGVVITSIFENTQSPVVIHLIHDDTLTQDNREKFLRTVQKYSQEIEFVNIEKYKSQLTDELRKFAERWTIGTLYRLFIPEVLDLDKVIYLDSDILVNLDIKNFWDIDFEGKSLVGATPIPLRANFDGMLEKCRRKFMGSDSESYVNAGVLIMNLRKMRERGSIFKIAVDFMLAKKSLVLYPDQDALNSIFSGDVKLVSGRFNHSRVADALSDCIIHVTGNWKPWSGVLGRQVDRLYWKMLIRSAWGENLTSDELIDKINDSASSTVMLSMYHHRGIQCVKRILRSVWLRIIGLFRIIRFFLAFTLCAVKDKGK